MSIPIINFMDVTSGVGGETVVPTRNLGAMIISINPLVPTGQIISFTSASAVGAYFGTSSGEYLRAVFYFSWISKQITQPALLSFWFWNNDVATANLIFGVPPIDSLAQFNAITTGELELTMGGFTHTLTGINLSTAGSLAAVATDITTAINAYSAGGAAWTGATVTYSSTSGAFNLVSGLTGADTISVFAAAASDLAGPLGWLSAGTVVSSGTAAQTLPSNLTQLINISNNFGSFCFGPSSINTLTNVEAAANWNNSLTPNIQFIFSWSVSAANATAWSAALIGIGGNTATLQSPTPGDYPEMIPMMILAATNYNEVNSTQNYMYQSNFNSTPTVTSQTDFNTYTGLRINFYGSTQTAGQIINFYMKGFMMGPANTPQFQNLYANEIWFKDALTASILNLLLALTQIPANNYGRAQLLTIMQTVINQALVNGTIEVGKTLNTTQKLYITQLTGSPTAWQQVQNSGYWVNVVIQASVVNGVTTYTALYTLIYSKNDVILQILGSDVLI
jgi:hypothetical protein